MSDEANAYTDCWSANIVDINHGSWEVPARHSQAGSGGWEGLPQEHSGEHVPSAQSLQAWQGAWEAEPSQNQVQGMVPAEWQLPNTSLTQADRLFGPGCQEQMQCLIYQRASTPTKEKTVYEINEFCALLDPVSVGWQLQDIFATPPQILVQQPVATMLQQHSSSPELSSDVDDERLFEVTLKSNALRALREAELCGPALEDQGSARNHAKLKGPALMEDVTSRVAEMHVDPKTGIMSKLMGMLSPSLLGFPTNTSKKKKSDLKKMSQMTASSRRSERPATKSSTMLTTRRAQASACKQLGLIQHEEDFNDEVLGQYLSIYQQPLSTANLQGLATLAEVSSRPNFVLHEKEMAALLKESPYAT